MSERFFSETPITTDRATLDGAEAHHLLHVMRAAAGDEVTLFDGSGAEFKARIEDCGRATVELAVLSRDEISRELPRELTLAVALPKGDRQRWLVEKLVELGVTRLVPLTTQRSVAQPVDKSLDRLRRTVIEASKQCGRNVLMEIAAATQFEAYVSQTQQAAGRWIAHPHERGTTEDQEDSPANERTIGEFHASSGDRPLHIAIGPEGGFTEDEIAAARQAGWQAIDLGPRVLRVETAALAAAVMAGARIGKH